MKQICKLFARTFVLGVLLTHLILGVCELAGVRAAARFPVREIIYLAAIFLITMIQLMMIKLPSFPGHQLSKLLETEGYSPEFYRLVFDWRERCGKSGKVQADLAAAELLIDGGHYVKGFELLGGINTEELEPLQKQVYYNSMLYGAVLCGDTEAAERIYERGGKWLLSVGKRPLSASVKHTLGCFEYSRGRKELAEELFMQSLDAASSNDVICEVWLALMICYMDSGRETNAREALKKAAGHAWTYPLKKKVARAKELLYGSLAPAAADTTNEAQ